jgi:hypothetical protein
MRQDLTAFRIYFGAACDFGPPLFGGVTGTGPPSFGGVPFAGLTLKLSVWASAKPASGLMRMATCYLDSSALSKRYVEEVGTP